VHNHRHESGRNIGTAFFLNLAFTVIELVGGMLTNSIAIMSDAVHDFGDSLSLGLAWYFQRLSGRQSTKRYTYGYKRFSLLGAIINSAVLLAGSVFIVARAIPRLLHPQETNAAGMLALAVIGVIVNGAGALRTSRASSINERVVSLHLLEDVLGWATVLAGSIIMRITGLTIIDPILSVAIAFFVLANVFKNIRQMLPILLQGAPPDIDSGHVAELLKGIAGISSVHDLHIWCLDEKYNVLTVHAVLKSPLPAGELVTLKSDIRAALREEGIQHATIEFETPGEACGLEGCV
jgi:cobalt-zinc-cadmium efflux system protein